MTEAFSLFQIIKYYSLWAEHGQRQGGVFSRWMFQTFVDIHCTGGWCTNSLTVQVALQDQWKKANYDANAKKAKEPAKNPKEAHD